MKKGEYAIESGTLFHQIHTYLSLDLTDWQLRAYKKFYAPDFQLKSGTFLIPEDMPLSQALEKPLVTPVHTDITFMILPGWSVYDIDSYLSQKKFIKPGEFIDARPSDFPRLIKKYPFLEGKKSFEGFIYPDTHRIRSGADLEEFLFSIIGVFQNRIFSKMTPTQQKEFYATLILASIVEREERNPDEKAQVAGILKERLRIRMSL